MFFHDTLTIKGKQSMRQNAIQWDFKQVVLLNDEECLKWSNSDTYLKHSST